MTVDGTQVVLHCGPDAVDPSNPSPGETFHLVSGVKCFNCVVVIIDPGRDGFIAISKHALLHVVNLDCTHHCSLVHIDMSNIVTHQVIMNCMMTSEDMPMDENCGRGMRSHGQLQCMEKCIGRGMRSHGQLRSAAKRTPAMAYGAMECR